jgi:predicted amidohydrolase YtcJ
MRPGYFDETARDSRTIFGRAWDADVLMISFSRTLMVSLLWSCLASYAFATTTPAERVFVNGAVYTVDRERPWASAVAIRDSRILYVGDDDGARGLVGEGTKVTDLHGRMLLPGFHDSHMHPMAAGTRFLRCRLHGLAWPDEVLAMIVECAKNGQTEGWFRGVGLADEVFEGSGPHRSLLDDIIPHRPAFITNQSGFLAWVNTAALIEADLGAETADPAKGRIEREPQTGEPSGVLRNTATGTVYKLIPPPPPAQLRRALALSSQLANSFGITSCNAAKVWPAHHEAYVEADRAGEMRLRVLASLAWNPDDGPGQLEALIGRRKEAPGIRYRADAVKLTLDGDLDRRTAALLEPYVASPEDRGELALDAAALREAVERLDGAGFQVHVHAVGDRAVREALDAFALATEANGPRDRRHQLAHIELIAPEDIPRFARLRIASDFQALWAYLSPERQTAIESIGPERGGRLIRIRTLLDSGATVVAGSDWISESMNPLFGIQVAVTRRPPDGSGPAWMPEERVTLAEMIDAYTINGAWLARQEDETGSIEVGKAADLVVLEKNLFEVDPMKIKDVAVLLTLLDGEPVFQAGGLD